MWFLHAVTISLADLFFKGIQNTKLVNIQIAVRAYQFPFDDGGWNSPTRSMEMNSMGCTPGLKDCSMNFLFSTQCFAHCEQPLQYLRISLHIPFQ